MKKSTKSIITSTLLAVAFGALSVGSTFALFTSQSQTEIDIQSGIVNVEGKATLINYSSSVDDTDHDFEAEETSYSNDKVGNLFKIQGSIVTIDKMVPGDSLTVKLSGLNKSNVKTKMRLAVSHTVPTGKKDLLPALEFTFDLDEAQPQKLFTWQEYAAVPSNNMENGVEMYDVLLTISLPDTDDGVINFNSGDNAYQDAACSFIFDLQAVQGNAAIDPVDDINNYLLAELMLEGHNNTMHDAVVDMAEIGYTDLDVLEGYVYDLANDKFVKENTVTANKLNYFKMYETMPQEQTFSIYAVGDNWGDVANLTVGFDAGDAAVTSISYNRSTAQAGQAVIIRTNGGTLTVNAPLDTVKHYGDANLVNLTAVGAHSYYENGSSEQVNLKKGRLVLTNTEDSSVGAIYLQSTGEAYDDIILATQAGAELPNVIARDSVPLPTGTDSKTVVTIQTNVDEKGDNPVKTETINLYATQGTTGNDVYEATNGYDVTDLALLVVEASSNEAKAQAAQQISDPEVVEQVTESKVAVEVKTAAELQNALDNEANYILFKNDIAANTAITIDVNTIVDGNGYALTTSNYIAENARSINIGWDKSNLDVTIQNLTVNGPTNGYSRGLNIANSYVKLNVLNCSVYAGSYAINVPSSGSDLSLNINNSTISGWAALNIWAFNNTVVINNSTLTGTNNQSVSSWNNFATICFESNTTYSDDTHSWNNTVTVKNSTINAVEMNANKQFIVSFNGGSIGATNCLLNTENCKFNSTNGAAYANGGSGNSWINEGKELLLTTIAIDLSQLTIAENGYEATGTIIFTINGKEVSYSIADAKSATEWVGDDETIGKYYLFDYNVGLLTYTLDLDLWSGYAAGFALYLTSSFSA